MTTARVVRLGEKVAGFIEDAMEAAVDVAFKDPEVAASYARPVTPRTPNPNRKPARRTSITEAIEAVTKDYLHGDWRRPGSVALLEKEHGVFVRIDVVRDEARPDLRLRLAAYKRREGERSTLAAKADAFLPEEIMEDCREEHLARQWFKLVDDAWKCLADQLERQRVVSIQEVLV